MSMIPALSFLAASLGLLSSAVQAESIHEFVAFGDSLCDNGEPLPLHHTMQSVPCRVRTCSALLPTAPTHTGTCPLTIHCLRQDRSGLKPGLALHRAGNLFKVHVRRLQVSWCYLCYRMFAINMHAYVIVCSVPDT